MTGSRDYIRDGAEIYRRSFAIIRSESELGRFSPLEERVAVRIIHACGMTDVARDIVMSPTFAERAREVAALAADLGMDVRGYRESLGLDPGRLDVVRERIAALRGLLRKYGGT